MMRRTIRYGTTTAAALSRVRLAQQQHHRAVSGCQLDCLPQTAGALLCDLLPTSLWCWLLLVLYQLGCAASLPQDWQPILHDHNTADADYAAHKYCNLHPWQQHTGNLNPYRPALCRQNCAKSAQQKQPSDNPVLALLCRAVCADPCAGPWCRTHFCTLCPALLC
jgi:hypothetical protein